jgi:hypothetical protein
MPLRLSSLDRLSKRPAGCVQSTYPAGSRHDGRNRAAPGNTRDADRDRRLRSSANPPAHGRRTGRWHGRNVRPSTTLAGAHRRLDRCRRPIATLPDITSAPRRSRRVSGISTCGARVRPWFAASRAPGGHKIGCPTGRRAPPCRQATSHDHRRAAARERRHGRGSAAGNDTRGGIGGRSRCGTPAHMPQRCRRRAAVPRRPIARVLLPAVLYWPRPNTERVRSATGGRRP